MVVALVQVLAKEEVVVAVVDLVVGVSGGFGGDGGGKIFVAMVALEKLVAVSWQLQLQLRWCWCWCWCWR